MFAIAHAPLACKVPIYNTAVHKTIPAYTTLCPNVDVMLGQRLRRWTNIKSTLGQRLVFAEIPAKHDTSNQCCFKAGPTSRHLITVLIGYIFQLQGWSSDVLSTARQLRHWPSTEPMFPCRDCYFMDQAFSLEVSLT